MSRFMWMVCLCLLVAGCATTGDPAHNNTPDATSGLPTLDSLPVGDQLIVAEKSYRLQSRYYAASGRRCARLRGDSGESRIACVDSQGQWYLRENLLPTSLASTQAHGAAVSQVRVSGQSSVDKLDDIAAVDNYPLATPDAGPAEVPAEVVVDLQTTDLSESDGPQMVSLEANVPGQDAPRIEVHQDETLWRFAKRVTGNALNWEKIAEFNNIDDAVALQAGQLLAIPPDLPVVDSDN